MKRQDFGFDLPEHLIAQTPLEKRDSSRLLTLNKETGEVGHHTFRDILDYLKEGDCLVLNNSRVIPARLIGSKKDTGGAIELVLLRDMGDNVWECLTKPGRRAKVGARFVFGDCLEAEIVEVIEGGNRLIKFYYEGVFLEILDALGSMPLPHYIKEKLEDKERYQTVYSKDSGSAAAPTAGLHFTNELLEEIKSRGINIAFVTLHVGLGTFRPVKAENILDHEMHSEFYVLDEQNAKIINDTKDNGGRIFSVGTTSTRTIESIADENGRVRAQSGFTNIFIYPGYTFKIIDCLITNFHLPESTLIMLISAFAGRDNIMNAYKIAIENEYRFFSFGDSMLIFKK
ncbi:MAG: tRNA preQ1(34) S-adenosylmethionine ribosyltransferase-isomerase QueA [Clostridia bacterium]